MAMTKKKARTLLNVKTDAKLAEALQVTQQAVSKWGDDDAIIPQPREWQIQAMLANRRPARHRK